MEAFIKIAEWFANLLSCIGVVIAIFTFFGMITNKIHKKEKILLIKIWLIFLILSWFICFVTFFISLSMGTFSIANVLINVLRLTAIYVVFATLNQVRREE